MDITINEIKKFFPYESVFLTNMFAITHLSEEFKDIRAQFDEVLQTEFGVFNYKTPIHKGFTKGYCNPAWDNKVTFEVDTPAGILYYQFYDGKVAIGSGVCARNYDPTTHYIEFV